MIIFLGLAGSGKSTQGQLLAAHLKCPWVSTGNLLRQKMDKKTQEVMLKGEIIPDDKTLAVLDEEFKRIGPGCEFVLDGTPRTLEQARWLLAKANTGEVKIDGIIHLTVSRDLAKKRLLARKRPDDHDSAIAERFREYDEKIIPIVNYLKSQGLAVYDINGEQEPEAVAQDILKALNLNHAR